MARSFHWVLLLAALGAGCGKTNGSTPGATTTPDGNGNGGGGGNHSGSGGGSPSEAGFGGVTEPLMCEMSHPGPSPLTRLRNAELNSSFLAQVPNTGANAGLPWLEEGFDDIPASNPTAVLVERIHQLAHQVAELLIDAEGENALAECDGTSEADETCRDRFLTPFLERAYRRPVTDEDISEMNEVFATGKELGGDFASGIRAVVEVALQNPDFVYLLEQGDGTFEGDAAVLTGFETAARLAYFLTGAPPDAELFDAASKGPFSAGELEAQARRLVGTAPNRGVVGRFYKRLFNLGPRQVPPELGYTNEIAELADEESSRFIDEVTFDGAGTFSALVSQPSTWVNEPLARFYGYTGVTGAAFQKVQLDPQRRRGLFTQISFLKSFSVSPHPVQRALTILRNVLCYDPPPPPPDVGLIPPDIPDQATMREKMTIATAPEPCHSCHREINPVGFAFEHYDAVGKWRDLDNGFPVDSSGELYQTDAAGPFSGAPELMQHIADSDDAKVCLVRHWLEQAYRRDEEPEDACTKGELSQAFLDSDGKVVELLVNLSQTDNFRYRLKTELTP
jgi:hypothetical protein